MDFTCWLFAEDLGYATIPKGKEVIGNGEEKQARFNVSSGLHRESQVLGWS